MEFEHPEQQFLYTMARDQLLKHPASYMLEIGSFSGGSAKPIAAAIAEASPVGSTLICIDPFYGNYDEGLQAVLAGRGYPESSWVPFNQHLGPYRKHVIALADTRHNVECFLRRIGAELKVSFALIDGWHSVEAVRADLLFVKDLILPGGIILCHDANWPGISDAAKAFAKEYSVPLTYELGAEGDAPFCNFLF